MCPKPDEFYEHFGITSPREMMAELQDIEDLPRVEISDYAEVICALKDRKGFSFAEIVQHFAENDIETNRSAVYRVYKKQKEPMAISRGEENPLVDDETGEVVEE